ncbi:hypothetical protein H2514_04535 [Lysobacter sp. CW239]|uniref:DUF6448 family protein n=1 Tax=Lysobacteraceae TaxID=32033 RepID=UPI000AC7E049|nr:MULTISPECIES: DUF6448 family protein [Lysobacter]QOD91905.1 hypothetical protein H2514_04535 [Lysobacter sp. CW239]
MQMQTRFPRFTALALVVALAFATAGPAMAHCDSLDGPVIADAQKALIEKNVTPVLKWIPANDEAEVRSAFDMALAVRGESDTARTVADNYFFETLVRVHRASEGAGFTGIKPLGSMDPSIAAADRALETGNADALADQLAAAIRGQVSERFATAYKQRQVAEDSVEQGREYVESYVQFTHFVEAVDKLLTEGISHAPGESDHGH